MNVLNQHNAPSFMSPGMKILVVIVLAQLLYQIGYSFYLNYTDARIAGSFQVSWTGARIVLVGAALDTLYRQHQRIKALEATVEQLQQRDKPEQS